MSTSWFAGSETVAAVAERVDVEVEADGVEAAVLTAVLTAVFDNAVGVAACDEEGVDAVDVAAVD